VSAFNANVDTVKEKHGSNRFCIEFRRLNAVTKIDNKLMESVDDNIIVNAKFLNVEIICEIIVAE
jgi:hypothetical protein